MAAAEGPRRYRGHSHFSACNPESSM